MSPSQLAEIYRDIIRGYSITKWNEQTIYIKHLSAFDQVEIQEYQEEQIAGAKARGIPTRDEKETWLFENNLWDKKMENDLIRQRDYVHSMENTRSKLYLKSQLEQHDKILKEERKRLADMFAKKDGLFGLTAETYSDQKTQFFHMGKALFKDSLLKESFFLQDELDRLDDEDSYTLLGLFVKNVQRFLPDVIRRIAVAPYFVAPFYLCGEQTTAFLGKPMVQLSVYQNNLLNSGLHFKQIFMREDVPEDIRDDPAKIDEWVQRSRNMKEVASRGTLDGGSTGIVGATSQDLKAGGLKEDRNAAMKLNQ